MANITLQLSQSSATSMKLEHETFSVLIDRPVEKGGGGTGLMGGQYLLIGVGGCFCSNLFAAAQARDITIEGLVLTIGATISDDSPKRFTELDLQLSYQVCSEAEMFPKLLQIAEKGCISVNTLMQGAQVTVSG
ncbi:MAG: OsmC family protein [Bacteroidota bacterium]